MSPAEGPAGSARDEDRDETPAHAGLEDPSGDETAGDEAAGDEAASLRFRTIDVGSGAPPVYAESLVKAYAEEPVVRGIDFEVRPGECLGILGPNGAGKTTTIHMITCFVTPSGGTLEVFGLSVDGEPRAIKRRLGVVSQENNLDPDLTVENNLHVYGRYFGLPRRERRERAAELLEFVQLAEKAGDHIRTLSGGMRRRLTLARALISSPELLILDEPTTGLDPQARHVVWQKLRALNRAGVTMLLTTHYMEEAAQLCDRLLIMDHGRIIAEGVPDALIEAHIGSEVVEVFPRRDLDGWSGPGREEALARLSERADHVERAGDEVYGFFRDPEAARAVLHDLGDLDVLHRRATLEDVFLKLTGRELRE